MFGWEDFQGQCFVIMSKTAFWLLSVGTQGSWGEEIEVILDSLQPELEGCVYIGRAHLHGRSRLAKSLVRKRKHLELPRPGIRCLLICRNTLLKTTSVTLSFLRCSTERGSMSVRHSTHRPAHVSSVKAPRRPAGKIFVQNFRTPPKFICRNL